MQQAPSAYSKRLAAVIDDGREPIRVPDLDCADYLCFVTSTGIGGVLKYYFINNSELQTTTDAKLLFSKLIARILALESGQEKNIRFIARLFLLVYKVRKAVVVEKQEECALLEPDRIPEDQWSSPSLKIDDDRLSYSFWSYEVHKNLLSFWKLNLEQSGAFQYTVEEFPAPKSW